MPRTRHLNNDPQEKVRRWYLLQALNNPEPAWKDEDHPELTEGADAWVRTLRENDLRLEREKLGGWMDRAQERLPTFRTPMSW